MLRLLLTGTTFGLAAGLSPGPILALVVAQTLRYGLREGLKVSLAPILTDLPIVTLCIIVLSHVPNVGSALAWISIAGGAFVTWLGILSLRVNVAQTGSSAAPNSIRKAVAINLLNAHVYLFWLTVGAPIILKASESGVAMAACFIVPFYVCLCGSKMLLAVLVNRSRGFLKGSVYAWSLRVLGMALIVFGLWLILDGLVLFSRPTGAGLDQGGGLLRDH